MICVYAWEQAPEAARALSQHGGDEDWVILAVRGGPSAEFGWLSPLTLVADRLTTSKSHEIALTLEGVEYVGYITAHA